MNYPRWHPNGVSVENWKSFKKNTRGTAGYNSGKFHWLVIKNITLPQWNWHFGEKISHIIVGCLEHTTINNKIYLQHTGNVTYSLPLMPGTQWQDPDCQVKQFIFRKWKIEEWKPFKSKFDLNRDINCFSSALQSAISAVVFLFCHQESHRHGDVLGSEILKTISYDMIMP